MNYFHKVTQEVMKSQHLNQEVQLKTTDFSPLQISTYPSIPNPDMIFSRTTESTPIPLVHINSLLSILYFTTKCICLCNFTLPYYKRIKAIDQVEINFACSTII